ncbi:MAG: hypothetical protein ACF8AM_12125 [Rhodopirellula sp. JB055]|uniref:hypothetical protein n=1 Tax=Rhodopirellula sp. JB055 TaxID=3342846 RepID=UPI00370AAFAC
MPPALIVVGDDLNTTSELMTDQETIEPDEEEPAALAGFSSADTVASTDTVPELDGDYIIEEPVDAADAESDEMLALETLDSESLAPPADEPELLSQESPTTEDDLEEFVVPEDQPEPDTRVATEAAPMAIYTSDKSRRKKKSLIKTVGSPILGALLALPIGGGLLWYLDALPNLGFYPLDGTYNSSNQIRRSAAAPASPGGYTPPILDDKPQGRSLGEDLNDGESTAPQPVELDTSEADMVPATDPASEALAELTNTVPPTDNFETPAVEEAPLTEVAKPPVESDDSSGFGLDLPETALSDSMPETPVEEEPLTELPGLPSAVMNAAADELDLPNEMDLPSETEPTDSTVEETSTPDEPQIAASINEIGTVLDRLEGMDAQDPKYGQAVAFAYGMLSRLSADAATDPNQLQPLVDKIKSNKNLFVSFAKQVPAWISTPEADRQTDGAFILGKIIEAESANDYQIRLLDGKAYPVRFADDVEAKAFTAVAFGNLDASTEPVGLEINWMQPAQ